MTRRNHNPLTTVLTAAILLLAGCASYPLLPTVQHVDLQRFMGDWYVHAHIPAGAEENAFNGVESYALGEDGEILTSYVFREGSFDGEIEVLEPVGYVRNDETKATWGMEFLWPFEAEYLVAHLDEAHTETIIARSKRDYVWIMTREQTIEDSRLQRLIGLVRDMGYDISRMRRLPQSWPDAEHPVNAAAGNLALYTRR